MRHASARASSRGGWPRSRHHQPGRGHRSQQAHGSRCASVPGSTWWTRKPWRRTPSRSSAATRRRLEGPHLGDLSLGSRPDRQAEGRHSSRSTRRAARAPTRFSASASAERPALQDLQLIVMPALVAGIHDFGPTPGRKDVDAGDEPGHDGQIRRPRGQIGTPAWNLDWRMEGPTSRG